MPFEKYVWCREEPAARLEVCYRRVLQTPILTKAFIRTDVSLYVGSGGRESSSHVQRRCRIARTGRSRRWSVNRTLPRTGLCPQGNHQMLKSFGTKMGTRNTVAVDQLKFRKGSFPRLGVRVSMRWHRKLWKGTVTAVYRGENSESSSDDGNTSTVDSSDEDDTSDYDDDDNIYRAKLVGIKKDISYIEGAPLDPSQQNVSSDQLLNVGIKKDINCLPEIPMLVLNNEGAPSDSSQQNVSSNQLLTAFDVPA
ncbi:uncharacterized protein [Diadema antillarum]|uniref:uncharacterized protein n=1 Tax=Diadema antillarum TaxID=105358 RepID=UPI003A8710F9